MKGIGRMIKHKDMVYILRKMVLDMKVIGIKMFIMVKELKYGLMEVDMKANFLLDKKMEMDYINGQMVLSMMVIGKIIK